MSRRSFHLVIAGLLISPLCLDAQNSLASSSNEAQLIDTMIQAGAFAESFTQFCKSGNRMAAARDQALLESWAQRNHWASVQARLTADATLQSKLTNQKREFAAEFNAHRFKTAFACGLISQELASPAHDPSTKYRAQLEALDAGTATASSKPIPPATSSTNERPEPATPSRTSPPTMSTDRPQTTGLSTGRVAGGPSGFVVATTGEAANMPPEEPVKVGSVTFTPPAGWRVAESSNERAVLQAATQHTRAVLLVTELPLNGDFHTAFANAVRALSPVTGLKLQYPHEGVTGGGSPMIHIHDNGTLRSGKQRETIDTVGVAVGNSMVLALLGSGDWGGDNYGFQRAFEKMVATWKLSGERGPVWDPMHPPSPVGGRSGLFMGSRVENQLNPLGGMDLMAKREYLVLLPTGQAFHALPIGGHVLDMHFAAECTRLPHACGTYRIQGDKIDFTWRGEYGIVTRESSQFVAGAPGKSNVASFYGTRAFEVAPVQNLHISGRYTSTFAQVGSTAFSSTSVVAQTFINFLPDGTYQKSGFSSASFTNTGAAGTVQNHKGVQSGHYSLNGYTLVLTPVDGTPADTFTTVFEAISPSPKAVFINDKAFLRDGR